MEKMMTDTVVTPDEINTIQLPNVADGLDSVTAHFGWRPASPSSWVTENGRKKKAR
jgi:hypothetical protein